jgi:hypothetical protein
MSNTERLDGFTDRNFDLTRCIVLMASRVFAQIINQSFSAFAHGVCVNKYRAVRDQLLPVPVGAIPV